MWPCSPACARRAPSVFARRKSGARSRSRNECLTGERFVISLAIAEARIRMARGMKYAACLPAPSGHGVSRSGARFLIEPLEGRIAPALANPFPLGSLDGLNGFGMSGSGQVGTDASLVGDV